MRRHFSAVRCPQLHRCEGPETRYIVQNSNGGTREPLRKSGDHRAESQQRGGPETRYILQNSNDGIQEPLRKSGDHRAESQQLSETGHVQLTGIPLQTGFAVLFLPRYVADSSVPSAHTNTMPSRN